MGNMELLDKIDFKKADPKNMLKHFEAYADQCRDAYATLDSQTLPSYYLKPKKIVLAGMGGSGAANDIVAQLLKENTNLIVESIHNYSLPNYVDKDTLVIASSYSGNTEETLSTFISAYKQNAKLVAIATGGKLKILADKYKVPLFQFDYDCPPRGAFPYLFIILAGILSKLGYLELDRPSLDSTLGVLEEYHKKYSYNNSLFGNPAKILAEKLFEKIPVIYATEKLAAVAHRYKAEFNENAKNFAFAEEFPELNHKSTEGIMHPKGACHVLMLESNFEFERNIIRQNITAEILTKNKVPVERIQYVQAKDRITEILLFTMFCEFTSYYLAMLNRENPGINEQVDYLKEKLV